jgi:hypothetical protein
MRDQDMQDFVARFIINWGSECQRRGMHFEDFPDSNIRLLARVIALTLPAHCLIKVEEGT